MLIVVSPLVLAVGQLTKIDRHSDNNLNTKYIR